MSRLSHDCFTSIIAFQNDIEVMKIYRIHIDAYIRLPLTAAYIRHTSSYESQQFAIRYHCQSFIMPLVH